MKLYVISSRHSLFLLIDVNRTYRCKKQSSLCSSTLIIVSSCKRLAWVAGVGQIIINGSSLCQYIRIQNHVDRTNELFSFDEFTGEGNMALKPSSQHCYSHFLYALMDEHSRLCLSQSRDHRK
jgi:hypothetical protein